MAGLRPASSACAPVLPLATIFLTSRSRPRFTLSFELPLRLRRAVRWLACGQRAPLALRFCPWPPFSPRKPDNFDSLFPSNCLSGFAGQRRSALRGRRSMPNPSTPHRWRGPSMPRPRRPVESVSIVETYDRRGRSPNLRCLYMDLRRLVGPTYGAGGGSLGTRRYSETLVPGRMPTTTSDTSGTFSINSLLTRRAIRSASNRLIFGSRRIWTSMNVWPPI